VSEISKYESLEAIPWFAGTCEIGTISIGNLIPIEGST
jgi:hypothetical protein